MDINEIKKLVQNGESNTLEFKTSTSGLKGAVETLCAYLNQQGGTVLIGVNSRGELMGQDVTDNTRQEVANELNKIEPPAHIDVDYIPYQQKQIIVLKTLAGNHAPYVYDGRPFQREQSSTSKMSQQRYDQLVAKRKQLNYSWEDYPSEYSIDKINDQLLMAIVRDAVDAKRLPPPSLKDSQWQILEKLKLLKDSKLLNAAVVLFGITFLPDYPQCQLKVARFKGTDRREFLDSDIIYGNAFELLEKGMFFVEKHLPVAAKIVPGELQRVETPLIPFQAIREALINAICHRDYSNRSGSIGLAIYDDRMEIFNNGGLQHGITLEMIKKGYSDPRNPLIAEVFYKVGLIEKWGRGIQEIISNCLEAGDPAPDIIVVDDVSFTIQFRFPRSLRNLVLMDYSSKELAETLGLEHDLVQKLAPRQREILTVLLSQEEMTVKQIAEKLSNPPSERMIRNDLSRLKQLGLVDSGGKTKSTKWFYVQKKDRK